MGRGGGTGGREGGGIFVAAAKQEAQDGGPRARGGVVQHSKSGSGSRAAVVGGRSCVAVIGGGSRAAVIGGLSCAVVLAVIVRIDPLTEKEKAG